MATITDTKVKFTITILLGVTNESNTLSRLQMQFRATSMECTSTVINQGNLHQAFPMV